MRRRKNGEKEVKWGCLRCLCTAVPVYNDVEEEDEEEEEDVVDFGGVGEAVVVVVVVGAEAEAEAPSGLFFMRRIVCFNLATSF